LRNENESRAVFDNLLSRQNFEALLRPWGDSGDEREVNSADELLQALEAFPPSAGLTLEVYRALAADEAVSRGEGVSEYIANTILDTRKLYDRVVASRRSGAPPVAGGKKPQILPPNPPATFEELAEKTNLSHEELRELESLLVMKKHVIFEGPPGSGKTYIAEKFARYFTNAPMDDALAQHVIIVQFHQSYGYEDFVQGIRPETSASGHLEYHVRDGIFKRFCGEAMNEPASRFVMVVDEINRGNISRIFGELLFLLEYRRQTVTLPYASESDALFSIPDNIYLLGTMNTADRSLAQIDYALRRRFYFYSLLPVVDGKSPVLDRWLRKRDMPVSVRSRVLQLFITLNQLVQQELGEHFQVGHSYFMDPNIGEEDELRLVWRRAILPLLREYFYNHRNRETLMRDFELDRLLATLPAAGDSKEE
jgi:5-methylcytosine-specific restriction protein B